MSGVYQFGKFVEGVVAEDNEGCTVIYPPLDWQVGARVILAVDESAIRYTVTPAGRAMLDGGE